MTEAKNPLDEVTADEDAVTVDRVMSKSPHVLTDEDLTDLVEAMRRSRARFIAAEAKKEAKREGIENTEDLDDGE